MGRLLSFLILFAATFVARADNWANCASGTGPAVSVTGCYGAGAGSYPGNCPTSQLIAADDLVAKIEADAPDGSVCSGGTVQGQAPAVNTDNQYGYFKKCAGSSGEDRGSLGIIGSKVCIASAACQHQIGDELAGPFVLSQQPADEYCIEHCQAVHRNFGLTIRLSGQSDPYVAPYFEVTATSCTVTTPPPANLAPVASGTRYCAQMNGQQVCASSEGALMVTINDMQIQTGPNGVACGNGQCVEAGQVVQTDKGTIAQASTPSPPAPAGSPDLQLAPTSGSGDTYNYWAPSAGGSSETGGGTPGATCGGQGQPECAVKLTGTFTVPINDKTAPTFAEALTSFNNSIQNAPILSAVSGVAAAIPTQGQIPGGDITLAPLGGVTLHIGPSQQVIDAITPILSALSLCAWVLCAIFIILSA